MDLDLHPEDDPDDLEEDEDWDEEDEEEGDEDEADEEGDEDEEEDEWEVKGGEIRGTAPENDFNALKRPALFYRLARR